MPEHSRSRLQGWIEAGKVLVNGGPAKVRQVVGPDDELTVWTQPAPETRAFAPEPVDFEVVDASPDWIVVNKPAGLVTHPGAGNWSGTLLNGLLHRYPELAQVARAGIVHRLDKDTSGLMVVARNETARPIWYGNCRPAAWDANISPWRMAGWGRPAGSIVPSAAMPGCRCA